MNLLAEIREGFGISWNAIRANKMRSVLTTLGIVIGIVTVTLMGTAIEGLNHSFLKSISALGADVFYVGRNTWLNRSETDWLKERKRRQITIAEAQALASQLTQAAAIAPTAESGGTLKCKNRSASSVWILGTTEEYLFTSGVGVTQGRFISSVDAAGGRPVCVIGTKVATNLFRNESPIGNRIKIEDQSFEIIGVLEKQGNFLGMFSLDNRVVIPLKQFISSIWCDPSIDIQVKAKQLVQLDEAHEELRHVLRRVRRLSPNDPDDFSINQQDQFIKMFNKVAGTIAAIGLFITGLSLFVGGIGIMNIMLVSVTERTREIGIRRAIGAKKRNIMMQFVMEAVVLCEVGGVIGVVLGIIGGDVAAHFLKVPTVIPFDWAVIGLVICSVVGIVFGTYPTHKAANLDPIESLRYRPIYLTQAPPTGSMNWHERRFSAHAVGSGAEIQQRSGVSAISGCAALARRFPLPSLRWDKEVGDSE